MAAEQLDLQVKTPSPVIDPALVACIVTILSEAKIWLTAEDIALRIGGGISDRRVREIARASRPRIVSYPGSPGYKLWELCTIEEIVHCMAAFHSQGSDMFQSEIIYLQAYHRRFRGINHE